MTESDPYAAVADIVKPTASPEADPYAAVADVVSESRPWQDTQYGFKVRPIQIGGKQTVERPDTAVYMTEAVDPRFKGQEGWKYLDPKTGVYVPAPATDPTQWGWLRRNLGPDTAKSLGRNIIAGVQRPFEAVEGLLHDVANVSGLESDPTYLANIQRLEERERYRQALANQAGGYLASGQLAGEAVPALVYGALMKQPPPSVGWVGRAAVAGAQAAPYAYATTPGTQGERTTAALTAGVTGAVGQAALQNPATRWVGQKAGEIRKRLVSPIPKATTRTIPEAPPAQPPAAPPAQPMAGVTSQPGVTPTAATPREAPLWNEPAPRIQAPKPEYAELEQLGQTYGITLRPGDITGDPIMRRAEDRLMRQTPEMQDLVATQAAQAKGAAEKLSTSLRDDLQAFKFGNLEAVQAAAKGAGKRALAAKRLLDAVDASGQDWRLTLQTSGKMKLFAAKLKSDAAYEEVNRLSAQFGEVPLVNTVRTLQQAREELQSAALPDQATLNVVERMYRNLNRQAVEGVEAAGQVAVGSTGPAAQLPAASAVDTTYSGLRQLRSDIGDLISDYYLGKNAVVGKKGVGFLEEIKGAIERDMDVFAQNNGPQLRKAWKEADRIYKEEVVPFKNRALAQALSDESPEKMTRFFLSNKDPYLQGKIFKQLDPKGQAALRSGLLEEAIDYAGMAQHGAEGISFSPAKFANWLEKHDAALKTAFKGEDKWGVEGLRRVMRHIDRVSMLGANPMTGQVLEDLLVNPSNMTAIGAANQALGALEKKNLLKLYTTPEGKRYLLQASEAEPGSAKMQRIIDRLSVRLPRILGISAGRTTAPTKRAPIQEEPESEE